jgi:integrase
VARPAKSLQERVRDRSFLARRHGGLLAGPPVGPESLREIQRRWREETSETVRRALEREYEKLVADLGERPIAELRPDELAAWRRSLPANRHHQFRAVAQVLNQAVRWEWIEKSPARHIVNPKPKAPEIQPFADWAELEAIAEELDPRFDAIPLFSVGTGLRPEEWIALERRDVDRAEGVVHVRRVFTHGQLKECAKSSRQCRRVPLRHRVLEALERPHAPARLAAPIPGIAWRAHRAWEVPGASLDSRPPSSGHRAPQDLRLPPHLRHLVTRRRRLTLQPEPPHGNERRHGRRHLRTPCAGCRRA